MKENDFLFWLSGFLLEKKELLPSEVETLKGETERALTAIINKRAPIGFKTYEDMPFPAPEESYYDRCACNPKNGGSGVCNCTLGRPLIDISNPNNTRWKY